MGTDTRESQQRIKGPLVTGLAGMGVDVLDGGVLPTAAISYLIASDPALSGGVMISASHNPVFENGIKVFDRRGMKIKDDDEQTIEENFLAPDGLASNAPMAGHVLTDKSLEQRYVQGLIDEFKYVSWRGDKLLVDCAQGATYRVAQSVLGKLGLHYQLQNTSPDGTNINQEAGSEQVRKAPRDFADEIRSSRAELGIAFDGDADRVVFVDREGILYDGDLLLAILAHELQAEKRLKGNTVVITQMANSGLAEHLGKFGIQTKVVHNGDKYITDMLVEHDLALGGEQIGHLIVHTDSRHVTGDGLRTALWVLSYLAKHPGMSLRDLTQGMRKWPQVNISVHLGEKHLEGKKKIAGLAELLACLQEEIKDISRLECRPASTEPVYRIMLEARETSLETLTDVACGIALHIQKTLGVAGEPVDILDCVSGGRIPPSSVPCFRE